MHIFLGSLNPVKINSVVLAASETWPNAKVVGMDVPSGVSEQPRTDEETKRGAENRAIQALEDGLNSLTQRGTFSEDEVLGIGLEGGVFTADDGTIWNTVWAAVTDSHGTMKTVNGERFELPPLVAEMIKSGKEMGPALSSLIQTEEINKKQGMIGVITGGFSDRTEAYSGIAKMALGLWYGRNWANSIRSAP